MDVFEDNLCLILDLEGFFINKKFHVRELGYCTWNGEHGRHAFSLPIPYETLQDKDKRTVDFVCHKIHGLKYQPSRQERFQNPLVLGILVKQIYQDSSKSGKGQRTVVGYMGGHVEKDLLEKLNIPSLNHGLPQIRCIENSIRLVVTQLRFSQRRYHLSLSCHWMSCVLEMVPIGVWLKVFVSFILCDHWLLTDVVGFDPKGNPNSNILKFTKIIHQFLQIHQPTLHLLLGPLSLDTIAMALVNSDQETPTRLEFTNDLENQVHSSFHGILGALLFQPSSLRLHAFLVIAQTLHLIVHLFQNRFVTPRSRNRDAQDQFKTASNEHTPPSPLCDTLPPITSKHDVISEGDGGIPLSWRQQKTPDLALLKRAHPSLLRFFQPWPPGKVYACWDWVRKYKPFTTNASSVNWI